MPKVGPFLNCNQADTKRPNTVIGTVPRTMPNINASIVADIVRLDVISGISTAFAAAGAAKAVTAATWGVVEACKVEMSPL